jgi:phosphatidylinositol alpha-1,6-mannosyltransferase
MQSAREPKRVLLLFTEVFANGGIQRFNQTLLSALGELGVHCDILSMCDSRNPIGGNTLPRHMNFIGFGRGRVRFAAAMLRAICGGYYDWIVIGHVNLLVLAISALMTKPLRRTRTILIAHGIEVWYRMGVFRKLGLPLVSIVLCVSKYTRQRILDQVPRLHPDRLRIFPNALGALRQCVRPSSRPLALPQRFILSVTRLEKGNRYKGIASVIEAFSMIEDLSIHYVVVGCGNDLDFLQFVAKQCGVQDRVHFLSDVIDGELVVLYQQCEAFVLPSGGEGFGIVFLEAMFFGAPVIAASEKGALDVIQDGETGLLIRFGDTVALKRAIERLMTDAVLRDHLRRLGRSTVVDRGAFTFARFVERTAAILELPPTEAA